MESTWLNLEGEDVEVFFTTSPAEKSNDRNSPSFTEEKTIYFVEKDGKDILGDLTKDDIYELETQL